MRLSCEREYQPQAPDSISRAMKIAERKVRETPYGQVILVVEGGNVVQIDRMEKERLKDS